MVGIHPIQIYPQKSFFDALVVCGNEQQKLQSLARDFENSYASLLLTPNNCQATKTTRVRYLMILPVGVMDALPLVRWERL